MAEVNAAQAHAAMEDCIAACMACHQTCLATFAGHCLDAGGEHTRPEHARMMLACAEMCRASAAIMMIGTRLHRESCRACAAFCRACADDCERIGGMDSCVAACRRCADTCAAMAG